MLAHPVPLLIIVAGVGCYALSLLCWLVALHSTPLNIVYPLLSTSYALVYLLAVTIPSFAEPLVASKAAGGHIDLFRSHTDSCSGCLDVSHGN